VTYEISWEAPALSAASRFLKDDPIGLRQLLDAIDLLAFDPRPENTVTYGSDDLRRIHVGKIRAIYQIKESIITVVVVHVGRVSDS
jgi:mRNA interferase RelE/StbE